MRFNNNKLKRQNKSLHSDRLFWRESIGYVKQNLSILC